MNEEAIEAEATYSAPKTQTALRRMVEDYLDSNTQNDEKVKKDRDYFDGHQLSSNVVAELEKRGQPKIYTNKVATAINGMLGLIDSAQTAVEAFPRTYKDADAADVATKVLRYLADRSQFQKVKRLVLTTFSKRALRLLSSSLTVAK